MKAFKGTDKDLKCRNFQYEVGKDYEHNGEIKLCSSGFHACENPLDVFSYYPPDGKNRFFEVEQDGTRMVDEDKTVSSKLKIKAELSISQLFTAAFKIILEKVKVSNNTTNTSGDYAHANTAGNEAHANTAGNYAHANTAGFRAHANTAGFRAHANTAGNEAHANTAGNYAHANTAGNEAHANTAGFRAHANTAGSEAIACALGIRSKAKAVKGWIVIVDWRYDDGWTINNIYHAKVGRKIKGKKIKPDTWYWFENGELKLETK